MAAPHWDGVVVASDLAIYTEWVDHVGGQCWDRSFVASTIWLLSVQSLTNVVNVPLKYTWTSSTDVDYNK